MRAFGDRRLVWIAHRVGRTQTAAWAGTAQTRVSRCDTLSAGLEFDWRSPFRHLPGLLGPAYITNDFNIFLASISFTSRCLGTGSDLPLSG